MGITVQKHFSNVTATTSKRLQVRSDVIVKQFLLDTQEGPTDKIENETFDFQLCLGKSSAGSTGITYVFLFFLPFTITIFPTLYIYILLIRSRMDFSSDTKNNTKLLKYLEIPTWGTLRLWWGHEFSWGGQMTSVTKLNAVSWWVDVKRCSASITRKKVWANQWLNHIVHLSLESVE